MSESPETIKLKNDIWLATKTQGVFGCFEVTIGWFGRERVDYMTYDTNGIWRCYEIKISKSDFHSKNHNTFCGNFNYYVMPNDLYESVKTEIPSHIGVHNGKLVLKKPKRIAVSTDENTLKNSMIRSLCRDVDKQIRSGIPTVVGYYKHELAEKENSLKYYRDAYSKLQDKYYDEWETTYELDLLDKQPSETF